jgi:hypothetical protein
MTMASRSSSKSKRPRRSNSPSRKSA